MRAAHRVMVPLAVALAAACSDAPMLEPTSRDAAITGIDGATADPHGTGRITVMNQNAYVGANLDTVIAALASPDPTDDLPQLLFAIQALQATDFPSRAAAIAAAIARARPHAVGLQEISTIAIDLTGFGIPIVLNQDFLSILEAALADRGLHYVVAAKNQNFAVAPLPGISLTDYDVLLVDADRVTVNAAAGHTFAVNLGVVAPGVDLKRGWVVANVTVAGQHYVFTSAHPESGHSDPGLTLIRTAQLGELVGTLPTDAPVILLGDLNDYPDTPPYQVLTGAGLTDVWRALRPGVGGYTCCHADDLSEQVPRFDERIDYVFTRGLGHGQAGLLGQVSLTGDHPSDRVPGPLYPIWPSDHAGLIATLLEPPAHGFTP